MACCRRNTSLLPSPATRRGALRKHEPASLFRRYSKSSSLFAQYNDNDGQRPPGLSDLEWFQLLQYRRWKRRLQDNPYQNLFGASENMLKGKGLKDWSWTYKVFPTWMVREMEKLEKHGGRLSNDGKKVWVSDSDRPRRPSSKSGSHTWVGPQAEPATPNNTPTETRRSGMHGGLNTYTYSGSGLFGCVISPSDPRRALDDTSKFKDIDQKQTVLDRQADSSEWRQTTLDRRLATSKQGQSENIEILDSKGKGEQGKPAISSQGTAPSEAPSSAPKDRVPLSDFAFNGHQGVPDPPRPIPFNQAPHAELKDAVEIEHSGLKAEAAFPGDSDKVIFVSHVDAETGKWTTSPLPLDNVSKEKDVSAHQTRDPSWRPVTSVTSEMEEAMQKDESAWLEHPTEEKPGSAKSTAEVLSQLPKDDIDFLSADEIRAAMGQRKRVTETPEEKHKTRRKLERDFREAHRKETALHEAVAPRVLNEQFIRRAEKELREKATDDLPPSQLETSMDRMRGLFKHPESSDSEPAPGSAGNNDAQEQKATVEKNSQGKVEAEDGASQRLPTEDYPPLCTPIKTPHLEPIGPLRESQFRPFADTYTKLGKDTETPLMKSSQQISDNVSKMQQSWRDQGLVREIKQAYEDTYGPITIHHRQPDVDEQDPVAKLEADMAEVAGTKETTAEKPSDVEETIPVSEPVFSPSMSPSNPGGAVGLEDVILPKEPEQGNENSDGTKSTTDPPAATPPVVEESENETSSFTSELPIEDVLKQNMSPSSSEAAASGPPQPYTYQILMYHEAKDKFTTTTITCPSTSPPTTIPLAKALAELPHPPKFISHLPPTFEPVAVKLDGEQEMLVVLIPNPEPEPSHQETEPAEDEDAEDFRLPINPIDGTTRPLPDVAMSNFASPTGFVNYEDHARELWRERSREQLADYSAKGDKRRVEEKGRRKRERDESARRRESEREGRPRRGAGVVKAGIYAAAACYIVGVAGEVMRA